MTRTRIAIGAITGFLDDIRRARDLTSIYGRLDRMSDSELAAHGLKRGDITREAARRAGIL